MKRFLFLIIAVLFACGAVFAEPARELMYKVEYWVANVKGGLTYPTGDTANDSTPNFNFGISARRGLDRELSAGGGISYVALKTKKQPSPGDFGATVIDAEIGYAPYFPNLIVWPYFRGGLGLFLVKYPKQVDAVTTAMGSETALGFLFGGGVNYPITKMFAANLELMYNQVSVNGGLGNMYSFLTIDLGVTLFLK